MQALTHSFQPHNDTTQTPEESPLPLVAQPDAIGMGSRAGRTAGNSIFTHFGCHGKLEAPSGGNSILRSSFTGMKSLCLLTLWVLGSSPPGLCSSRLVTLLGSLGRSLAMKNSSSCNGSQYCELRSCSRDDVGNGRYR
jgi:hypothetical protein